MDLKQRITWQLQTIRHLTESMISSFTTPQTWTHQLFPGANHALWVLGHLSLVDNNVLGKFFDGHQIEKPAYRERFGRGSRPTPNPAEYPPPEEVLAFWRERRATLLACLADFPMEDLDKPVPPGLPPFVKNAGQMFAFIAIHEALHGGQLSMSRRALGNAPVVG